MKTLIMCEGSNELTIINMLLENDCLIYSADDLIGLVPYHARQIGKSSAVKLALNMYTGEVQVLRIGDALNENFSIPSEYKEQILKVEKYCTKPELEMLLVIAEGLDEDFEKVKSNMKPKDYAKRNISIGRKSYDNSSNFYREYFGSNIELLVDSIKEYKRIKKHRKDELFLADLLK